MKARLQALLQTLNHGLVEREHVLKLALLSTLAGENMVLVGPPGTGKSLVARRIAQSLSTGAGDSAPGYFEYLLTKFSTPEELFGPLSISALKADRFHRNTEGYLPTVQMAFLDEIFKASSSILNALLTILNERVYHNGTQVQPVPLQALIAASNELPNDQEELSALYDRFLVRVFVDYVSPHNLSLLFEPTTEPELSAGLAIRPEELQRLRQAVQHVAFESDIIQAVQDIWNAHKEAFKEDRRESLSDRRLKKIIHLLRVSAATNGRRAVDLSDVLLLKDCLWSHPDNAAKVKDIITGILQAAQKDQQKPPSDKTSDKQLATVKVPQLSESITEATLLTWKKRVGDFISKDEILIEIETDKVVLEVPAPSSGFLFSIEAFDGSTVASEQIIAHISQTKTTALATDIKNTQSSVQTFNLAEQIKFNLWL